MEYSVNHKANLNTFAKTEIVDFLSDHNGNKLIINGKITKSFLIFLK